VVVQGKPGQEYVLQHFDDKRTFQVPELGNYWMGTIHAGDPRDSVDASAILVEDSRWHKRRRQPAMVREAAVVEIDPDHAWARRFNLASEAQVYLHTEDVGSYRVHLGGTRAEARIEPFFTTRPQNYRPPDFQASGSEWTLDPGYHVLTIRPRRRGICEVVVRPSSIPDVQWGAGRRGGGGLLELEVERQTTVAFEAPRSGEYLVETEGVPATLAVHSGAASEPGPTVPARRAGKATVFRLEQGPHQLVITPKKAGRLALKMRDQDGAMGWDPSEARLWEYHQPVRPATHLTSRLVPRRNYTLHLATQPGVATGLQIRKMPVDLREPVFVGLRAGDELRMQFEAKRESVLEAVTEDGRRLELVVDGKAASFEVRVSPGVHLVRVPGPKEGVVLFNLGLRDPEVSAPLEPVDPARLEVRRPSVLRAGPPRALTLTRGQVRTYALEVEEAGLYRVETVGLLRTGGVMRSRMNTSLAQAESNGTGRNFLVQRRLGVGEYRVDVAAKNRSAGPLGVRLGRSALADGGRLRLGVPARMELDRGEAGAFRFEVTAAGLHRVEVLGQDWDPPWVVEDEEGWPLVAPGTTGARSLDLREGRYRLVLDPGVSRARRVVRIHEVTSTDEPEGKGPHPLVLADTATHEYVQPGPDLWTLRLTAPASVRLALGGERLVAKVGEEEVTSGATRTLRLPAGEHTVEVSPARKDDHVYYTLTATATELLPGQTREVQAAADLGISIGEAGTYELATFGSRDVRLTLRDDQGEVVAAADDGPADWNPQITVPLAPGSYRLRVEPVGTSWANTEVSLVPRPSREEEALSAGTTRKVALGEAVLAFDLGLGEEGLWELTARAPDTGERVALEVERAEATGWRRAHLAEARAARIVIPAEGGALRARLWSLDRRGGDVEIALTRLPTSTATEDDGEVTPTREWTRLELERPGVFEFVGAGAELSGGDGARRIEAGARVALPESVAWARGDLGSTLLRVEVGDDAEVSVPVPRSGIRQVDLMGTSPGPRVAWVRAPIGQPGIHVGVRGQDAEPTEWGRAMAVRAGAALAVQLAPGPGVAHLWAAADAGRALTTRVRQRTFKPATPTELADGSTFGVLASGASKAFRMPVGTRRVRASLEAGMVLVLASEDRVHHTLWADGAAETFQVASSATQVLLFQTGGEAGRYSLDVLPADAQEVALPAERRMAARGRKRIAVPAGPKADSQRRLHVAGPGVSATYVSTRGRVLRGVDLRIGEDAGWLDVVHRPGVVRAWVDDTLRPGDSPEQQLQFEASGVQELDGALAQVALAPPGPRLARVRSGVPVVATARSGDETRTWTADEGLDWAGVVGFHQTFLNLRGVHSARLRGDLEVLYEPLLPLGEGLGPELLLPPGGARGFLIELSESRRIGLGVRSVPSGVATELRKATGELVGEGVQQLHSLDAGRYVWIVRAPADGLPCRVRPAVVGLEPPGTGPPPNVLKKYQAMAPQAEGGSR
jgi:hypothetical protein